MSVSVHTIHWSDKAAALYSRVPKDALHPDVMHFLRDFKGKPLLVGCSGGADSVFLLCILNALQADYGYQLVVAHYNHRWRAEASKGDAEFVEAIAAALELPFEYNERPAKEAAFTETTARSLRLNFLREVAKRTNCSAIALGHQQDDILETQLIRLGRGAGADGLAAPRPISRFDEFPTHVRPLLEMSAANIRMDLQALDIPWREDSSNADTRIARNALRHEVIPALEEALSRDLHAGAARSRMLLEEDSAALDALAKEVFPRAFTLAEQLDRARLRAAPRAVTRRALVSWLAELELIGSVSAPAQDLILAAIYEERRNNRFSVGAHYLVLDAKHVSVEWGDSDRSELERTIISLGDSALLSTGAQLCSDMVELDAATSARIFEGRVDPAKEAYLQLRPMEGLEIRAWQAGDRYLPLGAPGHKKLKDWFIDRRIPRKERNQLPLVLNEAGVIIWVPGFPPAEACKLTPGTKLALRLTYNKRHTP